MPGSYAVCVGINQFEYLPRSNWLNGCVNDAEDFARVLKDSLDFPEEQITVLTDGQATKAGIMGPLSELVQRSEDGEVDHLVFTFSSHGTQVPDVSGDEPDRKDEAFAPHDIRAAGHSWDPDTIIVDDELSMLFGRVPGDVLVEVFIDACNSGTGLRDLDLLPGRRPKFLPAPSVDSLTDLNGRYLVEFRDLLESAAQGGANATVLFAACRADQTASDAHFAGRANGAFTYYLLQAIRSGHADSRRRVLRRVRAWLRADGFPQVPQLDATPSDKRAPIGS